MLPELASTGEVLLADPGRPHLKTFLDAAAESWEIASAPRPQERAANLALYSLSR